VPDATLILQSGEARHDTPSKVTTTTRKKLHPAFTNKHAAPRPFTLPSTNPRSHTSLRIRPVPTPRRHARAPLTTAHPAPHATVRHTTTKPATNNPTGAGSGRAVRRGTSPHRDRRSSRDRKRPRHRLRRRRQRPPTQHRLERRSDQRNR